MSLTSHNLLLVSHCSVKTALGQNMLTRQRGELNKMNNGSRQRCSDLRHECPISDELQAVVRVPSCLAVYSHRSGE